MKGLEAYRYHAQNIAAENFFHPGFRLELGLKDINLLTDEAKKAKVPMPLVSIIHSRFLSSLAKDRGDLDWAATMISNKILSLVGICLGFFMVMIDVTVVNVALPSMAAALGSGISGL
jgi:NAD-binding of NADP-dependent 3-hydroxyisobutyrate dehydrogenase